MTGASLFGWLGAASGEVFGLYRKANDWCGEGVCLCEISDSKIGSKKLPGVRAWLNCSILLIDAGSSVAVLGKHAVACMGSAKLSNGSVANFPRVLTFYASDNIRW